MSYYDDFSRDIEPAELDLVYADLHAAQREAMKYRDALVDLFCVVKALSCLGGLSTPTLREYLRQHPALKAAASALGDTQEF
jgi:hypothetical protein